jgi:hypothetical protein
VAIVTSPNRFTADQTVSVASGNALVVASAGTPGNAMIKLEAQGNQLNLTQQTDWSMNTSGPTTYDSVDITHMSAGDAIFVSHHGGVLAAHLETGSVGSNTGIVWVGNPGLSGAAQNGITVSYVASGAKTPLSVSVSGNAIKVNLATDGSGNPTSTAAEVIATAIAAASVQAVARAFPLTVSGAGNNPSTSTGTGVVGPMGTTNLGGAWTDATSFGGCSAFNSYIPLFNDDGASGQGTQVAYLNHQRNILAIQANPYAASSAITIDNRGGGPAIALTNQSSGRLNAAPSSPADGSGMALSVNDYSTADTIAIVRRTPPVIQSFTGGYPSSKGSVISIFCADPSDLYPVFVVQRSGISNSGIYLKNDGTAAFGKWTNPPNGRVWIEGAETDGAASETLWLNNPTTATSSGAAIRFAAANTQHASLYSIYDTTHKSALLTVSLLVAGSTKLPLVIGGAVSGPPAITVTAISSGVAMVVDNSTTGATLASFRQNGFEVLQISNAGRIKFANPTNEGTGSKSAALGSNCPAADVTAPHTWETVTTSDGSTGYIPVWK